MRPVNALLLLLLLGVPARGADVKFQQITVKPGDTLWSIAQAYLKDPKRWNEILRYNKLPSNDPTVALPGTPLRVPVELIKEELRAAKLVHVVRKVLSRRKDTADWNPAELGLQLFRGDGLRTMAQSWARVQFLDGPILSLDPDSMAILKPPKQEDNDLRLTRGGIHTTMARVATPSARIVPKEKGTQYTARVLDDLSTRVQVYKGAADVEGGGKTILVKGGFYTDVPMDQAPSAPLKIPNLATLQAEAQFETPEGGESLVSVRRLQTGALSGPGADTSGIAVELEKLALGIPVAAYHVQAAKTQDFSKVLFEKTYDPDEPGNIAADLRSSLAKGNYWVRVAIIDLLGTKGNFSPAKVYRVGQTAAEGADAIARLLEIRRPVEPETTVQVPRYRILGKADRSLRVTVNGQSVSQDEDGNFSWEMVLKEGANTFEVEASDDQGRSTTQVRTVRYEP